MGWIQVAKAAANFFSAYNQSIVKRAQQDAQHEIDEANAYAQNTVNNANADAANTVRRANNDFQAAQAALQNSTRSLSNREKMDAFGRQYGAQVTNELRMLDSMSRGSLTTRLQASSALGALRADAAARGVGGGSASIMRSVASLGFGSAETVLADKTKQVTYDSLLQKQGLIRTAVLSQDLGVSLPSLDYGVNVAPLVQAPIYVRSGSAFRDAIASTVASFGDGDSKGFEGGTSTSFGGSKGWYESGAASASSWGNSFGFAQGNANSWGFNNYTGTQGNGLYSNGGLSGTFSSGASSSGWFGGGGSSFSGGGGGGGMDFFGGA